MFKNFFCLLLGVCFLTSCNNNDDNEFPVKPDKDSITILSYLIANNNLDSDLLANIGAMYDGLAGVGQPVELFVYWDGKTMLGSKKSSHVILKYSTDGKGNINGRPALDDSATLNDVLDVAEIVKSYTDQNSTEKNVFTKVLNDMVMLSSTDKFGLVIGSHGSSWLNTIKTGRALGYDGSVDNSILLTDMVNAITSIGKTFEFILFDACYMGTVEVCPTFRNVADYQIASVMEVPAYGFPYDTCMKYLYQGTVEGYKLVCQKFVDYYKTCYNSGASSWGTVALVDSKEMENLTNVLKQEIVAHKDLLADYRTGNLQEYGKDAGPFIAYDVEHFVRDLNQGNPIESFEKQLKKTILYKGCLENAKPTSYKVDASNFCGLGIYIPVSSRPKWNEYFKTLDWYTVSGWNEVAFDWNF